MPRNTLMHLINLTGVPRLEQCCQYSLLTKFQTVVVKVLILRETRYPIVILRLVNFQYHPETHKDDSTSSTVRAVARERGQQVQYPIGTAGLPHLQTSHCTSEES